MTTNKPKVCAIIDKHRATGVILIQHGDEKLVDGDRLIRLSDYEALQAANARLHAAIRRLCSLYVVYDHYDAQLREELLDKAVIQAISATMEPTK